MLLMDETFQSNLQIDYEIINFCYENHVKHSLAES